MPQTRHVEISGTKAGTVQDSGRDESRSTTAADPSERAGVKTRGRKGTPLDIYGTSGFSLSPLLYHLPSFPGVPSIKGFLPSAPTNTHTLDTTVPLTGSRGVWQTADLGDGRGKVPLLLITSVQHALQIYAFPSSTLPDDPHVQETWPAPEEVFSLAEIRGGMARTGKEQVLCASLLNEGDLVAENGPVLVMVMLASSGKAGVSASLAVVLVSLRTATTIRRVDLGPGSRSTLDISSRAIVIATANPSSIHILDPQTLDSLHPPLIDLPPNPRTGLPVFSLSHRLLAYTTSDPPLHTGPNGLGSIVTAHTASRPATRPTMNNTDRAASRSAILSSAVGIGEEVARGVWAGLKMGAKAATATAARSGRLAKSAPAEGFLASRDVFEEDEDEGVETREPRSLRKDTGVRDASRNLSTIGSSRVWIKIIDLFPRNGDSQKSGFDYSVPSSPSIRNNPPMTIAHFRLPHPPSYHSPLPTNDYPSIPVNYLSFSPTGTHLFASPADGRSFRILELRPAGAMGSVTRGEVKGEVWDQYELRRGSTVGDVSDIKWNDDGRWIGVATGRGTIHIFLVDPLGGPPSSTSHVCVLPSNPSLLYSLSTVVSPIARLRPQCASQLPRDDGKPSHLTGSMSFMFTDFRADPLKKDVMCQDMVVYHPGSAEVEVIRSSLSKSASIGLAPSAAPGSHKGTSALTEMMRNKAGLGDTSDLSLNHAVKSRWLLPLGDHVEGSVLLASSKASRLPVQPMRSSLARAEIQTYSTSPSILPSSIYLSHQVEFFAARPIDDYSPLSISDPEARTHRLHFRPEILIRSVSTQAKSFDEPLLTALRSTIPSPTAVQIPGLPNGYPGRNSWRVRPSLPIRQVASGLGEGVGLVRREYAKAQSSRMKRRMSEAEANKLSFEEDAVFANGDDESGLTSASASGGSHSSGIQPESNGASGEGIGGEGSVDEDWGEGWEEEYERAVVEDGGPEELVLGLMDEEEEERRKWAIRRGKSQFERCGEEPSLIGKGVLLHI